MCRLKPPIAQDWLNWSKQPLLPLLAMATTGFIIKAHTPSYNKTWVGPMPLDINQLSELLAETFNFHPHSLKMLSRHQASGLYVHLVTQMDLDVVVAEMNDEGMHALTVELTGMSISRYTDAYAFLLGVIATMTQIAYVATTRAFPLAGEEDLDLAEAERHHRNRVTLILSVVLFANVVVMGYAFDYEFTENTDFKKWMADWRRSMFCALTAPLSVDLVPFLGCKAWGFHAPVRQATRDTLIKYAVLFLVIQDGALLANLFSYNSETISRLFGEGDFDDESQVEELRRYALMAAAGMTILSLVLNVPRRVSAWAVASCQARLEEQNKILNQGSSGESDAFTRTQGAMRSKTML